MSGWKRLSWLRRRYFGSASRGCLGTFSSAGAELDGEERFERSVGGFLERKVNVRAERVYRRRGICCLGALRMHVWRRWREDVCIGGGRGVEQNVPAVSLFALAIDFLSGDFRISRN